MCPWESEYCIFAVFVVKETKSTAFIRVEGKIGNRPASPGGSQRKGKAGAVLSHCGLL